MPSSKLVLGFSCLLIGACYQEHAEAPGLTGASAPIEREGEAAARAGAPAIAERPDTDHARHKHKRPHADCPHDPHPTPPDAAVVEPEEDAGSAQPSMHARSVSTFSQTTCALLKEGTVQCWGDNSNGALGEGTFIDSTRPVQVHDLQNVVQLDVGLLRVCAVVEGGALRCWGDNIWDVLRVGDELDHNLPVTAQGVDHVAQVSLGEHQTCVRHTDNTLDCWGYPSDTDLVVQGVPNVVGVEAGYFLTTATLADGSVRSYGKNDLAGLVDVANSRAVSSGYAFVCVLAQDATVSCHGLYNVHESVPRVDGVVSGLQDVVSLSSGFEHSCAVTRAGKVSCWGRNNRGQLGDGATMYRVEAREVPGLEQVAEVTCGREHSCARKTDGSIYCWGSNDKGELGDGTNVERHSPVPVLGSM